MAHPGWLRFAGIEVTHAARTRAYARRGAGVVGFDVTDECLCDAIDSAVAAGHSDPALDPAPWFSETNPSSSLFAGLLVTDVEGLDEPLASRSLSQGIGGGGLLGPERLAARLVTVRGALLGRTQEAVNYGLQWLTTVLRGRAPISEAVDGLGALEFYQSCPQHPDRTARCSPTGLQQVTYSLSNVSFPAWVGKDVGGWVLSGVPVGEDCAEGEFHRVDYPLFPRIRGNETGELTTFTDVCVHRHQWHMDTTRFAGWQHIKGAWPHHPDFEIGPTQWARLNQWRGHVAGGWIESGCGFFETHTPADLNPIAIRMEMAKPTNEVIGPITGEYEFGFDYTQSTLWHDNNPYHPWTHAPHPCVAVRHKPTGRWLPITRVDTTAQYPIEVRPDKTAARIQKAQYRPNGRYRFWFNADGLHPYDLEPIMWNIGWQGNQPGQLLNGFRDFRAGWVSSELHVPHGDDCPGSGWDVGGLNYDDTVGTESWTSGNQVAEWMTAHDPNGHTWTHQNGVVSAIVPADESSEYGPLTGCDPADVMSPDIPVSLGELTICTRIDSVIDLADWLTRHDTNQAGWVADLDSVSARVPAGRAIVYGSLWLARNQDGTDPVELRPMATLADGAIDETLQVERLRRTLRQVGLHSGPRITDMVDLGRHGWYANVEFDLAAQRPGIYGATHWLMQRAPFDPTAQEPLRDPDRDCATLTFQPDCFPPPIPMPLVSGSCFEPPLAVFQACTRVQVSDRYAGATLIFEVEPGLQPLRNLRIVVYERRIGDPPAPACGGGTDIDFYECNRKLGAIEIPELPERSYLRIDGRDEDAVLRLRDGSEISGHRFIHGEDGTPLAYVTLQPGTEAVVVFEADTANTDGSARVSVGVVPVYEVAAV